jgi:hypothetical protein
MRNLRAAIPFSSLVYRLGSVQVWRLIKRRPLLFMFYKAAIPEGIVLGIFDRRTECYRSFLGPYVTMILQR